MPARIPDCQPTKTHLRPPLWPGVLLAVAAAVWTATMLASLEWRFLDRFVQGTYHGQRGLDFFQIPRGYDNWLIGNSILLTDVSDYGPYASPYLNHPFLAMAIGPWTAPLAPWTAYWVFVVVSLGLLLVGARALASAFQTPAERGFVYFALFGSLPTYLMLWNAQVHVLVVLAVALLLAGLMRLSEQPGLEKRYGRWIQLGLLISLLSKPVVILMLPVLFLLPETRRKLFMPLAVYAVVSLLFLVVPGLNAGGFNGVHWLNLADAGSGTRQFLNRLFPMEFDLLRGKALYALPLFVDRTLGCEVPPLVFRLPLLAVLLMSLSPLVLDKREDRLRGALVTILLCIHAHFLCYFAVQEYHYTTLLPTLPVMLWLWRRESVPWLRRLLMTSFVVSLLVFAPTACFLAKGDAHRFADINLLERVVPVAVSFVCLAAYGLASVWRGRRRPKLVTAPMLDRLWPAMGQGALLAILLGSVAATAWATVPSLLRMPLSRWTERDHADYCDAMIAQVGRTASAKPGSAEVHNKLGIVLNRRGRPEDAITEFRRALAIAPRDVSCRTNLGTSLAGLGRFQEGIAQLQQALEVDPKNTKTRLALANMLSMCGHVDEAIVQDQEVLQIEPSLTDAETRLAIALLGRGRFAEAAPHFRHVVELQPDNAGALSNWAWLQATCPIAALRNGAKAVEYARRANELAQGKRADILDTLAAAYAEAGRFPEALSTAQQALALAERADNAPTAIKAVRVRIALYKAGRPFRDSPPPPQEPQGTKGKRP
jgi:Flp pilus assembly protein TadD